MLARLSLGCCQHDRSCARVAPIAPAENPNLGRSPPVPQIQLASNSAAPVGELERAGDIAPRSGDRNRLAAAPASFQSLQPGFRPDPTSNLTSWESWELAASLAPATVASDRSERRAALGLAVARRFQGCG